MATSNPRYECKGCKARPTRNQLRGSNGVCIYCKTPMHHTNWLGGQAASLPQLLGITKTEEAELQALAEDARVDLRILVRVAVQERLRTWAQTNDPLAAAKNDMLLAKLYQR